MCGRALADEAVHGKHFLKVKNREKPKKNGAVCLACARDNSRLLPPAPRASRALQGLDDGVPVLHVEPVCTRLRKLRVVLQELEQDDDEVVIPRPETQHCGHEQKTEAQIRAKGTTERACLFVKEKTASLISKKNVPRGNLSPLRF